MSDLLDELKTITAHSKRSILRAMVTNYAEGNRWDHLDAEACTKAADEIDALHVFSLRLLEQPWRDMAEAPKDEPILAWCVHEADPYHLPNGNLTLYGGHVEGLSHVEDGPNILVWGGGWNDQSWEHDGGWMPDWWFQKGSEFEIAAYPVAWMPIPKPPKNIAVVKDEA